MSDEVDLEKEEKEKTPPAGAEQQPKTEELLANIENLKKEKEALEKEKKGIYGDLKSEQERRRELESQIKEKERAISHEKDVLGDISDDEFITGKHLRQVRDSEEQRTRELMIRQAHERAAERMANDELRMQERCEDNPDKFPVSYDEAIEAFSELAKKDPTLWEEVDRAKYRPGGRPAEVAYKIALREHSKFQNVSKQKVREELLEEIEKQGGRPKKLSPGGARNSRTLESLSEKEILELSDDELDKALR